MGCPDNRVRIRAHHLLCWQGFQGRGYDEAFVSGFASVVDRIRGEPDLEFEVVAGADAICASCPHRDGTNCRKDETADGRVRATDALVLEKLGLEAGHVQNAARLTVRVNATLKTKQDVAGICGSCAWNEACLWYRFRTD
jgi:hypothetical protein